MKYISVRGARQHNLRNLDLDIPRNRLVIVTGLSGSGKSSLAFDTLYAEGQRRYIESLSAYARQFLQQMERPDVDSIDGLSPAVSIEQKTTSRNARSTVGTITEVYDYLRLLFSSIGTPHCPQCNRPISRQSLDQIVSRILNMPADSRVMILAPIVRERKGEFKKLFEKYQKEGFVRARVDGESIYLENPPDLDKRRNHSVDIMVDRLLLKKDVRSRIETSVRQSLDMSKGLVTVSVVNGSEFTFSEKMACVECGVDIPVLEPRSFSFNSRFGACPACEGLGCELEVNLNRLIGTPEMPVASAELVMGGKELLNLFRETARALLSHLNIDPETPTGSLPEEVRHGLLRGVDRPLQYRYGDFVYRSKFPGLNRWFLERIESTSSERRRQQLMSFMSEGDCHACGGSRLRAESRAVRVNGVSISDYCRMPLDECLAAVTAITLSDREHLIAGQILEEIRSRLCFMADVGLSYLTLDRQAASLSAGESQRIRLATQVGSRLRGVLYVLDEPSIGLHPRDTDRLLETLRELRDLGNTIIVVEHDEETIRSGDWVIDLGPGAGTSGGCVVAQGTPQDLLHHEGSLTGAYLRGLRRIQPPAERRRMNGKMLQVLGARHNNLKDVNVSFPLGLLIAVTGVSGSGKSSLVDEVLYRAVSRHLYGSLLEPGPHKGLAGLEHLDKVIEVDQSPIGRTPRSNPATYTGLFTPIRELFSMLPEAKIRGYKPGRFSFNVKGGRCETCQGDGMRKIEMNFLPDVYVVCDACQGCRYNRETLSVKYKGHSIADILNLTIAEAYPLLENIPTIRARLRTLLDVGLGYIRLGQSATTLSGGEAQRVKLARELSKRSTGRTLYILDEPTTGLHFEDVRKLLDILNELVNLGNTVIVIEHHLEVIKCADWVIDLGPEGGRDGGRVVIAGTPEEIAGCSTSYTGRALKSFLECHPLEAAG
ncbi:MAG: excinuclease ABC subunit UvrA [Acidobacteria bacterium]|nr:MAG: excinuclease ABC subunit UvrA [Acidobacteriota bacterium]